MPPSLEQTRVTVSNVNSQVIGAFKDRHGALITSVQVKYPHAILADGGPWGVRDATVQYDTWSGVTLDASAADDGTWVVDDIITPLVETGWSITHQQLTDIQKCAQVGRDGYNVMVCGDTARPGFILSVTGPPIDVTASDMETLPDSPRVAAVDVPVSQWGQEP